MAQRGRTAHRARCYVYRIFDGAETIYVGKGSGRRLATQKRKFGADGEILEHCEDDDTAFARERHWIASLMPTANKNPGGNGGRVRPREMPPAMAKAMREFERFKRTLANIGPRRYVARFLLGRVNETNAAAVGVSKVDLFRLREVANGPWC